MKSIICRHEVSQFGNCRPVSVTCVVWLLSLSVLTERLQSLKPLRAMSSEASFDLEDLKVDFGQGLREAFELNFDNDNVLINQGSYGVVPKCVLHYREALLREMESSPDRWFRLRVYPHYKRVQAKMAAFLGSLESNLLFVSNATTGINSVIKSLDIKTNDVILVSNLIYPALLKLMRQVAQWRGAEIVFFNIDLDIRDKEQIVNTIDEACRSEPRTRVVMTDHIGWNTGLVFPVADIAQSLKAINKDIVYVVDGAHSAGQLHLDLEMLGNNGVDFYISNLHKWAFAPRSCAILWAHPRHHATLMPPVTSINWERDVQLRFFYQGTSDQTGYIATEASLAFIEALGGIEAIHNYVMPMLSWAQKLFADELGTHTLNVPQDMQAPYIKLVALPGDYKGKTEADADAMLTKILRETNVSLMLRCLDDKFWVRLSGSVYNTKQDYIEALRVLKKYV